MGDLRPIRRPRRSRAASAGGAGRSRSSCTGRDGTTSVAGLVERLAEARIGETFNQYADSPLRCGRLVGYLDERSDTPLILVGEAAGYRGARISGLPFTSERQLTGAGPAEATATIVQRTLADLGLADEVVLWNVVPTHPGTESSNRRPTRDEVLAGRPFLDEVRSGRRTIAVGRLAAAVLDAPYIRHPSHGGAAEFRDGLLALCAGGRHVRPFHA